MLHIGYKMVPLKVIENCLFDQSFQNLARNACETDGAIAGGRMAVTRFIYMCHVRLFPCCWNDFC